MLSATEQQQIVGRLRELAKQAKSLDKKLLVLQTAVYNETGLSLDEWFDRYTKDQKRIAQLQSVLHLTSLQQELVEALLAETPARVAALTNRILKGEQDHLSTYVAQKLGKRPNELDPLDCLAGQLSIAEAYKAAGIEMLNDPSQHDIQYLTNSHITARMRTVTLALPDAFG